MLTSFSAVVLSHSSVRWSMTSQWKQERGSTEASSSSIIVEGWEIHPYSHFLCSSRQICWGFTRSGAYQVLQRFASLYSPWSQRASLPSYPSFFWVLRLHFLRRAASAAAAPWRGFDYGQPHQLPLGCWPSHHPRWKGEGGEKPIIGLVAYMRAELLALILSSPCEGCMPSPSSWFCSSKGASQRQRIWRFAWPFSPSSCDSRC